MIALDKLVVRITNRYRTGFCGMLRDKDVVNMIGSFQLTVHVECWVFFLSMFDSMMVMVKACEALII